MCHLNLSDVHVTGTIAYTRIFFSRKHLQLSVYAEIFSIILMYLFKICGIGGIRRILGPDLTQRRPSLLLLSYYRSLAVWYIAVNSLITFL